MGLNVDYSFTPHLHGIQVESSPRASVQKSTPSETAAISSEKAALPTQQAAQTGKVSSDAPAPASKPAAGSKGKKKRQAAQVSETDAAQKPQLEEGDEGRNWCYCTTKCHANCLLLMICIVIDDIHCY